MLGIFESGISFLTTSIVLIAMGCVSLFFSVTLHRKSRMIKRLPKNLSATVFDKTFNVFNPYAEHRKTISSHIEILIVLAVYGPFIFVSYAVLKVFELGPLPGLITFIICLGLLMIEETSELHKNASLFAKAIRNEVGLGRGDVEALFLIERTLPRLSSYHLSLAIIFFASSIGVPYIINVSLLTAAQFASATFALSATLQFIPLFAIISVTASLATVVVTIQFIASRVKSKIFGFPCQGGTGNVDEEARRMKMFAGIMHHHPKLHVPEPEDEKSR